ncbi:extracellular solute-binding protein [Paenibacillus sp. J2TS4]|uniref:extracellular solute-binding protein n=1 Tax=Paenibacillus sp. J2TS4 TaxID=2807194 RepID=UPI001B19C049|nr:extracellular solute-binding protein [Paenibacillus sp. J2TS4]GIP36051.1 sugar ABC transporter substrate-binding protein [Paenibacillus sp. J2TS4]
MKKTLMTLLVVLLAMSLFMAACSSKSNNDPGGSDGNNLKPSDGTVSEGEGESGVNKTGMPIVNEKYSFKIMVPGLLASPGEIRVYKELAQHANLDITWDIPAWEQYAEIKNLMFASGEYPDVIAGWGISKEEVITNGSQGIYIPLEDLIDKYTVNLKAMLEERPDVKRAITAPDGHIYSLPIVGVMPNTKEVMHINKTWLDELGLEIPRTLDEFYEVLKAFKERDSKSIPFSFIFKGSNNTHPSGFFGQFGRIDDFDHLVIEDRKVISTVVQPEWKEAIQYLHKLFREGLIDPEVFTHDKQQYQAKGMGDLVYGVTMSWDGYFPVGEENMKHYALLPPMEGPNGRKPVWRAGDPEIFPTMFVITSAAKKPEAILRWLDEFFLQGSVKDGPSEFYFGKEGVHWEKTEDGLFKTLNTGEDFKYEFGSITLPLYESREFQEKKYMEPESPTHYKFNEIQEAYAPYVYEEQRPLDYLWLSSEQEESLALIKADILKYTDDKMVKWIVEGGIEDEWDAFVERLHSMRLQEMIDVYQEALDAYYAN